MVVRMKLIICEKMDIILYERLKAPTSDRPCYHPMKLNYWYLYQLRLQLDV